MSTSPEPTPTATPERSRGRTVLGWVLIAVAALALLGNIGRIAGGGSGSGDTTQTAGALVGIILIIAVPLVAGILLLRRPRA